MSLRVRVLGAGFVVSTHSRSSLCANLRVVRSDKDSAILSLAEVAAGAAAASVEVRRDVPDLFLKELCFPHAAVTVTH